MYGLKILNPAFCYVNFDSSTDDIFCTGEITSLFWEVIDEIIKHWILSSLFFIFRITNDPVCSVL